jgi:hypothetical protein
MRSNNDKGPIKKEHLYLKPMPISRNNIKKKGEKTKPRKKKLPKASIYKRQEKTIRE